MPSRKGLKFDIRTEALIEDDDDVLRDGQRKHDVELPNDEIAHFQEQRRPDRFFPGTTTPKPLHPIIIEGVPSMVQAGGHYE